MRKFLFVFVLYLFFIPAVSAGANPNLKGKILVIDPGHGGFDPGAVRGGVYEKNISLKVAMKLKKELEEKGATVIVTRDSDYNLAIPGLHKRAAHRYDLKKRLEIAEQSKAVLFVSIHVNSINFTSCRGAEAFYNPKSQKSKLLAERIQDELRTIPGMEKRIDKPSDCFILSNAKIPAVLVEIGYLSNPDERKKLLSDDYQTLLGGKISRGIQRYFQMEAPG